MYRYLSYKTLIVVIKIKIFLSFVLLFSSFNYKSLLYNRSMSISKGRKRHLPANEVDFGGQKSANPHKYLLSFPSMLCPYSPIVHFVNLRYDKINI